MYPNLFITTDHITIKNIHVPSFGRFYDELQLQMKHNQNEPLNVIMYCIWIKEEVKEVSFQSALFLTQVENTLLMVI